MPRPDDGGFFAERMTVRLAAPAHPGDKRTIFHAHQKVAHRARADVWVERGNHDAFGPGLDPLRGWHPIEVLHFSFRTAQQAERKLGGGWLRSPTYEAPLHQVLADEASRAGRVDDYFASLLVDDDALACGLADGTLAIDTRLRDALRTLRASDGAGRLVFRHPDAAEDAAYAAEATVLEDIDGIVRSQARTDALEARLAALERGLGSRFQTRAMTLGRRLRRTAVD